MISTGFPAEHLHLLSALADRVFSYGSDIVRAMKLANMTTTEGLEFASISSDVLPRDVVAFLRYVEEAAGCPVEIELLTVTGFVAPHHHEKCSCAIIRCDTEPDAMVSGFFGSEPDLESWVRVDVGRAISIPVGMVHAMRVDRPVNFISINAPGFDPNDVISHRRKG